MYHDTFHTIRIPIQFARIAIFIKMNKTSVMFQQAAILRHARVFLFDCRTQINCMLDQRNGTMVQHLMSENSAESFQCWLKSSCWQGGGGLEHYRKAFQ